MRYAKRKDENENELVKLARSIGALVWMDPPLEGWVFWHGKWTPFEIKIPEREGTKKEFTERQVKFRMVANERGAPHWVWRTEADVLFSLGARRSA